MFPGTTCVVVVGGVGLGMFADKLFAMLIVALCAENLQAVKICTSFACAQKHAMLYMLYMHYIYTRIYA